MRRLFAQPFAVASAGIAVAGLLATTGLLVVLFLVLGEARIGERLFAGSMVWLWCVLPYILNILGAIYFARWQRSSIILLIATIVVTTLVIGAITIGLFHLTTTVPLAFLILPMYQGLGILVGLWLALIGIPPDERDHLSRPN